MTRARQDRLLGILSRDGEWATAATLADALGVTPRSIRSYVTAVNARVPSGAAIESGPLGYRAGPEAAAALRVVTGADAGTPRDRLHTVVRSLLDSSDGIDVFETADGLHVSTATVDAQSAALPSEAMKSKPSSRCSRSQAALRGELGAQPATTV